MSDKEGNVSMRTNWNRVHYDLQYIILNKVVCHIPSWTARRYVYRKCGIRLESGSRIGIGTVVINPKGIWVGKRSVINESCLLDGRGGLVIGCDTSISAYTRILSASHKVNSGNFQYYERKTRIGSHVWIGTGATILDGSAVKDFAVIGAGAVFKGDAEEGDIYMGNPAKYIKKRMVRNDYHLSLKTYFR